jgi:hypothetical protein
VSDEIRMSDRRVRFARATKDPNFQERRVIASSPWEYVSLWLRKNKQGDAHVYWNQAKHFFDSAKELPAQSAPLPLYYCFLNATKALLETKGIAYSQYHGVTGLDLRSSQANARIRIDNEGLKIKGSGILPSLVAYFGETEATKNYTLGEVISNLAFIHRAYSLSYSKPELFLSLENPRYVKAGPGQARFQADLPAEHTHGQTLNTLPADFQARELNEDEFEEATFESGFVLESVNTFAWSGARRASVADIQALCAFHRQLRLDLNYISGAKPYWYVKRNLAGYTRINRNNLTLIFMAMHRMSEIARYKPIELNRLLAGRRNWIIYEFIRVAQNQFIDEIAAEITGFEISPAGVRQSVF